MLAIMHLYQMWYIETTCISFFASIVSELVTEQLVSYFFFLLNEQLVS